MTHTTRPLHRFLLAAYTQDENIRRREPILVILFAATFAVLFFSLLFLIIGYATGFTPVVLSHIVGVLAALTVTAAFYISLQYGHYFIAACGILSVYGILAVVMTILWSINLPSTLLLYSILIVLSGMILGARLSLYVLGASIIVLFGIEYLTVTGHIHPNTAWRGASTHLADLGAYYLCFLILGICSWLFNTQTDAALHRALKAEAALQLEKEGLESEVIARTRELESAQIEKMEQLYRFAELGQFSVSLLHDLGNHMATLSLDLEGIAEQNKHSELQQRIHRRIHYIDNMVRWAYDHINGKVQSKSFNTRQKAQEVIKLLQYNARHAHIELHYSGEAKTAPRLYGDPNRFRQLIVNLVSNAIDAYDGAAKSIKREIGISVARGANKDVILTIYNYGPMIPELIQEKIFRPFYSTKYEGMGIGLFVVKQIAEEHFQGSIAVTSDEHETRFILTLRGAKHGQ